MPATTTATAIWTKSLVKDLLAAKAWEFEGGGWPTWFAERGGPEQVRTFIRSCAIPVQQQELLNVLLLFPGEDRTFYAEKLKLNPTTVSEYTTKLLTLLTLHLNQWTVEPTPQPELAPAQALHSVIPSIPTSFIGREVESAAIQRLLCQPSVRLLTLTGVGGTGKTRLALHVAQKVAADYTDGVVFIDLSAVQSPDQVPSIMLQGLAVRDANNYSAQESIQQHLRDKHMLLVLDNVEQVLEATPVFAQILAIAPQITLLVTSRILLQLYGEQEYHVPALAVPSTLQVVNLEALEQFSAIALFVDRARSVDPYFHLTTENVSAVHAICAQLDGNPLAIELAAARIKHFSPQAIQARLRDSLSILAAPTRDRAPRQQTLYAAISWSYAMLTPSEQRLFARLSVFVGGCSVDAVEAICNNQRDLEVDVLEGLIALANQSLLHQTLSNDGEPHFRMLATIQMYSREQLALRGELEIGQYLHATYFCVLAEQAEPKLNTNESIAWLERLEREHDNIRAALQWTLAQQHWAIALRISGALWNFWYTRGYFSEGRRWLAQALQGEAVVVNDVSVKAIHAAGLLAMGQNDIGTATRYLERAQEMYEQLGWRRDYARVLHALGTLAIDLDEYERAERLYQEALHIYRDIDDIENIQGTIHNIGMIAFCQHDYPTARRHLQEALVIAESLHFAQGIVLARIALGSTAYWEKDYVAALRLYQEAYGANQELNDQDSLVLCLEGAYG